MSSLVALSLSIGVLGGIATFLFLKFGMGLLIWAAFIAWACYFHCGGNTEALKKTIIGNVFGVVCAWIAGLLLVTVAPAGELSAAVVVGLTVMAMCLAAHLPAFSTIPASVYGYAAVFAFLLGNASVNLTKEALTSATMGNALIVVALSMIIGALFGFASGKMGAALTKK
jgi:hypothetical protein